jgi:DNA-binding transcriptional ArsR family regulator
MPDIKDAAVLKAIAHPLRRRLLDVLRVDGPSMPSVLARATDQAVANISHHLRVLADAGLIAEAPERAQPQGALVADHRRANLLLPPGLHRGRRRDGLQVLDANAPTVSL